MSQFPKDDRELISFLQQYRPLPPPANSTLEKQLYARVLMNLNNIKSVK